MESGDTWKNCDFLEKWGRLAQDPIFEGDFIQVPKDLAIALYAALLDELKPEEMIDFWERVPLPVNGDILRGAELIKYFWNTKNQVPSGWINAILNECEPFLIEKGIDFLHTFSKVNIYNNRSSFIPGRLVLFWVKPLISMVNQVIDIRALTLQSICLAIENHHKGAIHKILKTQKKGNLVKTTVMHKMGETPGYYYVNDYNFFYSFFARVSPKIFGSLPFDSFEFLADARPLEWILKKENIDYSIQGQKFIVNNDCIAIRRNFSDFQSSQGLEYGKTEALEKNVFVMTRDFYSSRLKRTLLHKNCAYGAPYYLIRHGYVYKASPEQEKLRYFVDDVAICEPMAMKRIEEQHNKFLAAVGEHWLFEFDQSSNRLTCNNRLITRGTSALIMRRIIQMYLGRSINEMDYAAFREDPEIVSQLNGTSLELRMLRLLKNVEKVMGIGQLKKIGRGRVRFDPKGKIEFKEIPKESPNIKAPALFC